MADKQRPPHDTFHPIRVQARQAMDDLESMAHHFALDIKELTSLMDREPMSADQKVEYAKEILDRANHRYVSYSS